MGKTRDKNHLGVSLTNSKKPVRLTRSQKSKLTAAKEMGSSSVTDRSNVNELIDKLDYVTMMSSVAEKEPPPGDESDECSDDYEDMASDAEDEVASEDGSEPVLEGKAVSRGGDACLVMRDPKMEGPVMKMERELAKKECEDKSAFLAIPRRPKWTAGMKAEQLTLMESQTFAEWKYRISQTVQMLKHCTSTPFERNLDFWRQLWRVIERSDIVAQIVDARNPLLFFTEDLYKYCSEFDDRKRFFLIINKADFLTEDLRIRWANYFRKRNIDFKFFCAIDSDGSDESVCRSEVRNTTSTSSILSGNELIEYIKSINLNGNQLNSSYRTCGFIGYPNVGKSSTINHLVGASKTSTSATPGKTKHFQTLFIDSDLCLCDCPGLVMPNFVSSKADLLTNGILPIDSSTEFHSPISLIGYQLSWEALCEHYGFSHTKLAKRDAWSFLEQHAITRGFVTARGNPDVSKSAKYVLKDFVNGKLIYCHPPPDEFETQVIYDGTLLDSKKDAEVLTHREMASNAILESRIDSQFFASMRGAAHVKGATNPNFSSYEKPSKKHHNKNRKEKLKRVYKDQDVY